MSKIKTIICIIFTLVFIGCTYPCGFIGKKIVADEEGIKYLITCGRMGMDCKAELLKANKVINDRIVYNGEKGNANGGQ